MGYSSFLHRSPRNEEQRVPESTNPNDDWKFDSFFCIKEEEEENLSHENEEHAHGLFNNWESLDLNDFATAIGEEGYDHEVKANNGHNEILSKCTKIQKESEAGASASAVGAEGRGFFDEEEVNERVMALNLNLNYQEVMDAWSDRGSLWAAEDTCYMGEVPVLEEEIATIKRREASVLRYKEKRQCRLFSKKIRYEVRKLNADKRPRLKGRFVKRVS